MEMSAEDTQIAHVTGNHTARRALQTQLLPLPWKRSTIGYGTLCAVSQQDSRSPHADTKTRPASCWLLQHNKPQPQMIIKASVMKHEEEKPLFFAFFFF